MDEELNEYLDYLDEGGEFVDTPNEEDLQHGRDS